MYVLYYYKIWDKFTAAFVSLGKSSDQLDLNQHLQLINRHLVLVFNKQVKVIRCTLLFQANAGSDSETISVVF